MMINSSSDIGDLRAGVGLLRGVSGTAAEQEQDDENGYGNPNQPEENPTNFSSLIQYRSHLYASPFADELSRASDLESKSSA